MQIHQITISFGWTWMPIGILLGMLFGLKAESTEWAGGYDSYRRRSLRLAHISAIALPLLCVAYGQTITLVPLPSSIVAAGCSAMILGAILMPIICLASSSFNPAKYLFPLPAGAVFVGLCIAAFGHIKALLLAFSA